ncbi:MAG: T9SS type A sorting domain-containing protein [Bacteroidia bacterium]
MMILFLTVLFHPHPAFNQNIYINFKDGSHQQMALTDILKITFQGDSMRIFKTDGSRLNFAESFIGNYNYKGLLYDIPEFQSTQSISVLVYPNPGSGTFNIEIHLQTNEELLFELSDLSGKKMLILKNIHVYPGTNIIPWDGTDAAGNPVKSGIYFCKITGAIVTITKKIIVN